MDVLQQWRDCPDSMVIGSEEQSVTLSKSEDLYAVQGHVPDDLLPHLQTELSDDDIAIVRGMPPRKPGTGIDVLPVYTSGVDGVPTVVTKRVFLRLHESETIEGARDDIAALGFHIAEALSYAPNCAWLEPASGRIDEALGKLDALRRLPAVANAEPQLLRTRAWKRPVDELS